MNKRLARLKKQPRRTNASAAAVFPAKKRQQAGKTFPPAAGLFTADRGK
jgi:hypothetical protein